MRNAPEGEPTEPVKKVTAVVKIGETGKRKEVCVGEEVTFTLEVTGTTKYSAAWRKVAVADSLQKDGLPLTMGNLALADTGRYYCEVVDSTDVANPQLYSDTLTLVVRRYEVSIDAPEAVYCLGDTVVLRTGVRVTGSDTLFNWTVPVGMGTVVGGIAADSLKLVVAQSGRIDLNGSDRGCTASQQSVELNVNAFRVGIDRTGLPTDVCRGDSIELKAAGTGATTYNWAGAGIVGDTDQAKVKVKFNNNGEYVLYASDGVCSSADTVRFRIQSFTARINTPSDDRGICIGASLALNARWTGDGNLGTPVYRWEGAGLPSATNGNAVSIVVEENAKYVMEASLGVCRAKDSVTYTVHRLKAMIEPLTAAALSICNGDTVKLQAGFGMPQVADDTLFRWKAQQVVGATDRNEVKAVLENDGKVWLVVRDRYCVDSTSVDFAIKQFNVKIQPELPAGNVCSGTTTRLRATGSNGALYKWRGLGITTGGNEEWVDVKFGENGLFVLNTSDYDGKCSDTDTIRYVVERFSGKIVRPVGELAVCSGARIELTSAVTQNISGKVTYRWEGEGLQGVTDQPTAEVLAALKGKFKLYTSLSKCKDVDSLEYTIRNLRAAIVAPALAKRCYGDTVVVRATHKSVTGDTTYRWTAENIVGRNDLDSVKVVLRENGKVKLDCGAFGCSATDEFTFTVVNHRLKINTALTDREVCWGSEVTLQASNATTLVPGSVWTWSGDGVQSASGTNTKVKFKENGTFYLEYTDGQCRERDTIDFTVRKYVVEIEPLKGDLNRCWLDTLTLAASNRESKPAGGSYTWQGAGTIGGLTNGTVKVKLDRNAVFTLRAFDGKCYSDDTITFDIHKYDVGIRVPESGMAVCRGSELALSATNEGSALPAGATYSWSGEGVTGDASGATAKFTVGEKAVYALKAYDGTCFTYDTLRMEVQTYSAKIKALSSTEVCYGAEVTLEVTDMSGDSYAWSGEGIIGAANGSSAKVGLTENGSFRFRSTKGVCVTEDAVTFTIKKYNLSVPESQMLPSPQKVTLRAAKETGSVLDWYVNNTHVFGPSASESAELDIKGNAQVKVVMTMNKDKCTSTAYCNVRVGSRDSRKYQGGVADGFTLSRPSLRLRRRDTTVCVNTPAIARLQTIQYDAYNFEWFKTGHAVDALPVCTGRELVISRCEAGDGGTYYCRVKDAEGGNYIQSDTFTLTVLDGPVAKIAAQAEAEWCYGEEVRLKVSATANNYTYQWTGADIAGGALAEEVIVRAKQGGLYTVTVSDGECQSMDSVRLKVLPELRIDVPEQLNLAEKKTVSLSARTNTAAGEVTWSWRGATQTGRGPVTFDVQTEGKIYAELVSGRCRVKDSTQVYMKEAATFAGGENDGFDESVSSLRVESKELAACTGERVTMKVVGYVAANSSYEWYFVVDNSSQKVGSDRTHTIEACGLLQAGRYYCKATSGDRSWHSDTLTLTVNEGPVAKIQESDLSACYGTEQRLTAIPVDGSYEWSGDGIIAGRYESTVTLNMNQGGAYVLKVSNGSCVTTDTVQVQVVRPEVKIPDLMYLAQTGDIRIKAECSTPGTAVKWYIGDVFHTTSANEVELPVNATGKVTIYAKTEEQGCPAADTLIVFVKDKITFDAGVSGDDGFASSRPRLKVEKNLLQPCPTEDVVMRLRADVAGYYQYVWYKVGTPDVEVWKGSSYQIWKVTNEASGKYFCKALKGDEAGEFVSDTVELDVRAGVIAEMQVKNADQDLCYGEELSFTALPTGSQYTYQWSGPGVAAEATQPTLSIKAGESGRYTLKVSDGVCESVDTMSVRITRLHVNMAATRQLKSPGEAVFTAITPESTVMWYVGHSLQKTGTATEKLTIQESCRVWAQVEAEGCVDSAVCLVFVKKPALLYASETDDGFAESKPTLQVQQTNPEVCQGERVVIGVKATGYENYSYKWYKNSESTPVYVGREYVIEEAKIAHEGLYICKVTKPDADGGEEATWVSDAVNLTVKPGPFAVIAPIADAVCYGAETMLNGYSGTSQSGQAFDYVWSGPGADGLTTDQVTVKPLRDALYVVKVSDAETGCSDTASIWVKVNHLAVEIPASVALAKPQTAYQMAVYNPNAAALEWFIDDVPSGEMLNLNRNCTVKVKATLGSCSEESVSTVFVRKEELYVTTTANGDDDGFSVTLNKPVVKIVPKNLEICTANSLKLEAQIAGEGFFAYKWYRTDRDGSTPLSEEKVLVISDANANVAAKYYCIVVNLMVEPTNEHRVLESDTATVTYKAGPKAVIGSPANGSDVCNGVPVTLDASASEQGVSGANYTYEWFGAGAEGLTDKQITIVPKSSNYVVKVSDGEGCSSTDTVYLNMNSPEIRLPLQLHLNQKQTVVLRPEKPAGTLINWYVDGVLKLPNNDVGTLPLDKSCLVVAEVVKNVTDGTCSGYDTTRVYIKTPSTFTAGEGADDGFSQTLPTVKIRQLEGATEFCRGTEMFRTLTQTLPEKLLKYEWRKVGSIRVVCSGKNLVIPTCEVSDTGRYYCMVTDLSATDPKLKVSYSDTVKLGVLYGPVAKISAPVEGQLVCYRASLDLDASETEIGKYPYTDVYEYQWIGEHVKAPTLYHTQANPENSGRYILKATNGTCTTYDTVSVVVKAPEVHIQRSLFINRDVTHRFTVLNPEKNTVNWYLGNTLKVSGKDTANISLYGDDKVVVEMVAAGCRKTDTCFVFRKIDGTFMAGVGEQANDDGFYVSGTSFYINKVISTELVCNGATSVFTIEVVGNDFYRYAWKKKGSPVVISTEKTFRIEKTNPSHAGSYYCEVTDVSNSNTRISNEVSLEVVELPATRILTDRQEVCEGTSLTMRADESGLIAGRDYTYLWTGNGIADNRSASVTATPKSSGRYVLTITDANCFMKDTVDIKVVKQSLKVPKVYMIKSGEDLSLKAEATAGTVVNWRVNNIVYNNTNPLVLNGLKESVAYTAEAVGACEEKISGQVFVRSNQGYAGGEEDGFTMPNGMPQIIDYSPEIVGCGKDTASLFVEVLKKDEVKAYIWQKYDESKKDFAEWTPGLPDGHVTGLGTSKIHFTVITAEDEGRYRCRIQAPMGFVNGPVTNLVKGTVPRIDGRMNDIFKCEGKDIRFIVTASVPSGKDPQYRWFYSGTPANFRQLLPEADLNKPLYELSAITKSQQGFYMVEAYNLCGSVYDTAYLDVWQKPTIVRQSRDTAICLEASVRLWVEAKGGGTYGYSLYQIEKDKSGKYVRDIRMVYRGLEPWYDLPVASQIDQGDYVWMVWNECDSTRHSQSFRLTVESRPDVRYGYLDTTICIGTRSVVLDARANVVAPGASTRYRWTKNGTVIGQTESIHTINPLAHADTGVYKCYAYNACPDGLMKEFRVHKKEAPMIQADVVLSKASYCEGEPVDMSVRYSSDAGAVTQQWYFNSQPIGVGDDRISGMNTNVLSIDSVINTDNGRYYVILKNSCGDRQSNSVNLVVDMPARFAAGGNLTGKDLYLCLGDNVSMNVTATGKEPIDYTWAKGGKTIAGARTSRLQLNGVTQESVGEYCCYIQNVCNKQAEYTCNQLHIITPQIFELAGSGKYCGYEAGREVTLSGFEKNVVYNLYRYAQDGSATVVATVNGSEVADGGVLSFGQLPAGKYYAMGVATHETKMCDVRMKGEIEIIRDITPAQYEFVVSDPICTGETNGGLLLKGSENDPTIEYTLQRFTAPDSWNNYGRALPGNGGQLRWNNLAPGVYRVQAVSTLSGCTVQIGENDTLTERPYPEVFDLIARGGDTTNCEGMDADVVLELQGAEKNCRYTLVKNDVETDRVLSGESIVWDKVEGAAFGAVVYKVRGETNYGCVREMGEVKVLEKKAPIAFLVSGGGYYCSGDTGTQAISIDGLTQAGVRYDIFRKDGTQLLTDTVFYGTGRSIVFELPNQHGEYYVTAKDTLDGCVASMQNEFSVQEDSLKIVPIPVQTIDAGTATLLHADFRNNVGTVHIQWEPKALFPAGESTKQGPRTNRLDRGERFIVMVSDDHCTAEAYAEVRLKGASLYTQIKLQNCLTDADTLRLCEGEKVNLCSWTDGGVQPYTYKWLDKNVSPSKAIGTASQLSGYAKPASGYIHLEVTTGIGQYAQDSIWIAYDAKPKSNLVIAGQGLNCALMDEVVDFVLKASEADVKYVLEYSSDSRKYVAVEDQELMGDGSDLTFNVTYSGATAGYYRLQAEKVYEAKGKLDANVCGSVLTIGELRQAPQLFDAEVLGDTEYCAGTRKDSVNMTATEAGVVYRLVNTTSKKVVAAEEGKGDPILFSGYFGSGRYRVVGQLGICSDTMNGEFNINAVQLPLIGEVGGLGVYCLDGKDKPQDLVIKTTIRGVAYTLYRDSLANRDLIESKASAGDALTFSAPKKAGNYFIVSAFQTGLGCSDTVRGYSLVAPPQPVKLKVDSEMYCYADGGLDAVVTIYDVDPLVDYVLKAPNGNVVGTFGDRRGDSLYCKATLKGGTYSIWSTATQCSGLLGTYTVVERKQLADLKLIRPLTECEGFELTMGVQRAEKDVVYELYKQVSSGVGELVAQNTGDGGTSDLIIGKQAGVGTYFIRAVDPAGCELELSETYTISPLPQKFNITSSSSEYCAGDAGVVIGLDGTEANVNYLLQKWDPVGGVYVQAGSSAIIYGTGAAGEQVFSGKFKAGKYRVVSEGCHQQEMNGVETITEIPQPLDIDVTIGGMACVDSVLSIVLESTEPGIRYALLHNNVSTGLDTLMGTGGKAHWTFTSTGAGEYSVHAIRKACVYPLSRKVKVGVPTRLVPLTGMEALCANETGVLKLNGAVLTSDYKLWGKSRDTIFTGKVSGTDVLFQGVMPGDKYVVIANNQMCESRSEEYAFNAKELPVVLDDNFAITDCSGSGKGDILLGALNNSYLYTLVGPDCNVRLMNTNKDSLLRDMAAGEYCLTIRNLTTQCEIDPICKNVRRALPGEVVVRPLEYCDGDGGVTVRLSGSTYNVRYSMLNLDHSLIETINYPVKAFSNTYTEGTYVMKKENLGLNGGCVAFDTVTVRKVAIPNVNIEVVAGTGDALCEKGNNRFTLKTTEVNVDYVLRLNGVTEVDTLAGTGGALTFEGWKKAGSYEIIARSAGRCQAVFAKNWKVNPVPAAVNAPDVQYCYDPSVASGNGASVFVKNMDPSAKYYFRNAQKLDSITGLNAGSFKPALGGNYVVTGIYTKTGCWDTVARVKIEAVSLPDLFEVSNTLGGNCDTKARIRLSGSEAAGVDYYLYMNDYFLAAGPVAGIGGPLDFGEVDASGTYRVYAKRQGSECGVWMNGAVVIASEAPAARLEVRGQYCMGETAGNTKIALLNPVKGWTYFVSLDLLESKRVRVTTETVVEWDSLAGKGLIPGNYVLNGMNECDELKPLATITVKALPGAIPYKLTVEDQPICHRDSLDLILSGSEPAVSYMLKRKTDAGVTDMLPAPVKGTGESLYLGRYIAKTVEAEVPYYVEATVDSSACRRMIDTAVFRVSGLPLPPVITTPDTCIQPGGFVKLRLEGRRLPRMDYFLVINGVIVDTLSRHAHPGINYFKPQTELGNYDVITQNEIGCRTYTTGPGVAEAPDATIDIVGGLDTAICSGGWVDIRLVKTQPGAKYILMKDGFEMRDTIRGTGEAMTIKRVTEAGTYGVKIYVSNEISEYLLDSKTVKVDQSPELEVSPELGYCKGGKGVEIVVRNTKLGVEYYLYLMNGDQAEWVDSFEGNDGDKTFVPDDLGNTLFTKNLYRVEAVDSKVQQCPTRRDVNIREVDLPTPYALGFMEGNKYVCDYPAVRTLLLAGSQLQVEYSLYRRSEPGVLAAPVQEGTGKALSFVVQDTGKYYVIARSMIGEGCESTMSNDLEIVVPTPIQVFDLSGIKNSYCDTAKVVFGSVKLSGSEVNVNYELYRDGKSTGLVSPGNRSILKWSNLKGKPASLAVGGDADGYIYTVNAVNQQTGCSKQMTGRVSVLEETRVVINSQDEDLDVCMGSQQVLHVFASGGMLNYQWKKDGRSISNAPSYAMDSITQENIGEYQCVVSNQCGYDVSANIHVNVRAVVIQNKKMDDLLICEDPSDVKIPSTAVAETYKWYKKGSDQVISDKQILHLPGATGATATGEYICYAATTCGGIYDTCRLEFNRRPEVVWNGDVKKVLCVGSKHRLEVESRDEVKWYRDGHDLGVAGNVYVIDSLETAHAGLYTVVASNRCSSSDPIQLQTLFADEPIKVIQVTDSLKRYCKNSQITLEIKTQPSERVTYKWYRANSLYSDNSGNKLQITGFLSEQGVNYFVRYSNACTDPLAPPTQRGMTIRLDDVITYTQLPAEKTICADNGKTNLTVKSADQEGERYRWYYQAEGESTFKNLTQDTANLPLENKRKSAGNYYCDITNTCETVTTHTTTVKVDSIPMIQGDLRDTTVCENSNLVFRLKAKGGELTYTWMRMKKNGEPAVVNVYKPAGFATESQLDMNQIGAAEDSCRVWCVISNPCSSGVNSDTAVIRVVPNAKVAFEQSNVMMCDGYAARAVVKLSHGTLPAVYSYSFNGGAPIFRDLATSDTDTLTISQAGTYQLISLSHNGGSCVDRNPVSRLEAAYYERYTASIAGNFKGCVGLDAEFTVTIDKGEGPWLVEIVRESDGKIADEIGEFPMELKELVNTIRFKPTKNEHYKIKSIVQHGGSGCIGLVKGTAATQVYYPARVSFAPLTTDVFGGCKTVDFNSLLRPTVSGGTYLVNNKNTDGSTLLPIEAGKYHIVYKTKTAEGCIDSAKVDLTRDVLPTVTMSCADELCPGEDTDLKVHVNGTGPTFMVGFSMKEINLDGRDSYYTINRRTDASGNCSLNVFNNSNLLSKTYEVVSVTDKYGCAMEARPEKKVITMWERPLIKVETQHALYNNGLWTSDIHDFVIPDKGMVNFRVTKVRGTSPWSLYMEKIENGVVKETYPFPDNSNPSVENIQANQGVYRFKAEDKHCTMSEELAEIRKVSYTETGYLKLKVMLQGAYSNVSRTMSSQIESSLPLRGMSQLPVAGSGKQWIDWVVVELRKEIESEAVIRDTMLLRSDGYVTDRSGNELLTVLGENFSLLQQNAYYVVVKHRNHLPVASIKSRIFTEANMATLVDLTDAHSIYSKDGDLARHLKEFVGSGYKSVWCMPVGNVLDNQMISIANANEIQRKFATTVKGYYLYDVNFDGIVKWAAEGILDANSVTVDKNDDAYIVYKNRNLFSEVPEN